MRFLAIALFSFLFLASCSGSTDVTPGKKTEDPQKDAAYQKEMDELRKAIKSDVKVKLKKDGKGAYSWEIQGKDPQEVLKANETLKKKLGE